MSHTNLSVSQDRAGRVFQYLKSYHQHTQDVVRQVDHQPWAYRLGTLPEHEAVRVEGPGYPRPDGTKSVADRLFQLSVRRVEPQELPEPPEALRGWLKPGWDTPGETLGVKNQRLIPNADGESELIRFGENSARQEALRTWRPKRDAWAEESPAAHAAADLFESLYGLHQRMKREAENVELMLGDGLLAWENGPTRHPVLLRRLRLRFDASVPKITVEETGEETTLYTTLFQGLDDVDAAVIAEHRSTVEDDDPHPLQKGETTGVLKSLAHRLSSHGTYSSDPLDQDAPLPAEPTIARDPVLLLRKRGLGYVKAVDGVLKRIEDGASIPVPLDRVIGGSSSDDASDGRDSSSGRSVSSESTDVLLSKPANPEQVKVAEKLHRHGAVVVQGPPGTGKTHTIGNLIGDLLARGKRILVTSHTSKALRRVRDQVPEPLRSLCVSVLGTDVASRNELNHAVSKMASRLGEYDAGTLETQADQLEAQRNRLQDELREAEADLQAARRSEYDAIVIGGEEYRPDGAARFVRQRRDEHGWIPGQIEQGAPAPLSQAEAAELYQTNDEITPDQEEDISSLELRPSDIPEPDRFERIANDLHHLEKRDLDVEPEYWEEGEPSEDCTIQKLRAGVDAVQSAISVLDDAEPWEWDVVEAGRRGEEGKRAWQRLIDAIGDTARASDAAQDAKVTFAPGLHDEASIQEQLHVLEAIVDHLDAGSSLGTWTLLWRQGWKMHIESWKVNGHQPETYEEFEALLEIAKLEHMRAHMVRYWDRLIATNGGFDASALGEAPEQTLREYRSVIMERLGWYEATFQLAIERLTGLGLDFSAIYENQKRYPGQQGALRRLIEAAKSACRVAERAIGRLKLERVQAAYQEGREKLKEAAEASDSILAVDLLKSYWDRDTVAYEGAYRSLEETFHLEEKAQRRYELLKRVKAVAPDWAAAIQERRPPHDSSDVPGLVAKAWIWKQLRDRLEAIAETSIPEIQRRIDECRRLIQRTTTKLIEKKAWAAQIRRIQADTGRRQALVGWADTQRKIGKGYGKNVPALRRAARNQMQKCRNAVPVWIMPMNEVVDNFDAQTTTFDVVIVDEASQVDVKGLLLLAMADQVVIVGDHEQVSPSAVGEQVEEVQFLIGQHLDGIPNKHLYDGKTSIYDLARQSFGGAVGLREHFRCVPEIIQFSNALSYDFEIKPLRDATDVALKPSVISYRVKEASYENKLNKKEALHCASLVAAAMEDSAYESKSMGVISLVGEVQAERIEELLRRHVDPTLLEDEHRVMTGNPAQFQGAERDVMFLSVVNAPRPDGGPLRRRTRDLFKQRFNVAASRARDQMWVVHSLNAKHDLKNGDLRRRLIEHAQDPSTLMRKGTPAEAETESEFERRVLKRLQARGYNVIPQWQVGAYRIDLVVMDPHGKQLAVECDGERYHPPAKLKEDMERQRILERLGWTFHRIRGSLYFRDPDRAMDDLVNTLERMGIEPADQSERDNSPDDAVRQRVIRRAAEIRRTWEKGRSTKSDGKKPGDIDAPGERGTGSGTGKKEPAQGNGAPKRSSNGTKSGNSNSDSSRQRGDGEHDSSSVDRERSDSASQSNSPGPNPSRSTPTLFDLESEERAPTEGERSQTPHSTKKRYGGPYSSASKIPDRVIDRLLVDKLPLNQDVVREPFLHDCAAILGFDELEKRLRSRLNKYIRRQINAGWIEEINKWEKLRRVDSPPH